MLPLVTAPDIAAGGEERSVAEVIVRYRVGPDRVAENEQLVRQVYAALDELAPAGFTYATYRLADGVSFVHVASIDPTAGPNPLLGLPAFKAFTAEIGDRCDEPPQASDATIVASYGL